MILNGVELGPGQDVLNIHQHQAIHIIFFNMHQIWQQKIIEHLSVLDDVSHMFKYIPHIFPSFPIKNSIFLVDFQLPCLIPSGVFQMARMMNICMSRINASYI